MYLDLVGFSAERNSPSVENIYIYCKVIDNLFIRNFQHLAIRSEIVTKFYYLNRIYWEVGSCHKWAKSDFQNFVGMPHNFFSSLNFGLDNVNLFLNKIIVLNLMDLIFLSLVVRFQNVTPLLRKLELHNHPLLFL